MKEKKKNTKTGKAGNAQSGGRKYSSLDSEENILRMYLNEISRIPLLSREEEDEIARAAARGDAAARHKLINGNLRFVINVAKKYQGHGIPLDDLISEGNVGLIQAVERFDISRGYRFISYAVWWIRQSIIKALYEKSRLIRLPANQSSNLVRIEKAKVMIDGHMGTDAEVQEIARLLNMDESHIEDIVAISREIVSLEKQVNYDKDATILEDFIEDTRYDTPDQKVITKALEADIEEVLSTLGSREADIIRCRYGLGMRHPLSLKEIGELYNLTKERIRQIEHNAIMHLRQASRKSILEAYVA